MSSVDFHSHFPFSEPNKETLLTQDRVIVKVCDSSYTGHGEVYLRLLPRPRIEIRIRLDNALFTDFSNSVGSVLLESRNLDISGFATQFTMSTDKPKTLTWTPKKQPIISFGDDNTAINSVIFHVFNFVKIIGTRRSVEPVGKAKYAIEHVDLTSEDWRVELRSLPSTNRTFGQLKEQGGFGLTHIGRFEKVDRSPFSGKEAEELLWALRFFLSFAKGIWCEPVCAVGFDNSDDHVCWELWSSPREPWHSPSSWFDPHHCEQLVDLFPGFMAKWNHEDWREALREVIYWYLNANYSSRGIDVGIILTQAAIERLSYELAVRDRQLLSANGFRDIRASDKFRLLFSTLGMPLDIPAETPGLQKLATNSQMNWLDAPHALTEIRNSLIHPEHKRRGQFCDAYYEAWNLGLWYLEMSLLALCGYSGTYGNRLKQRWAGQVEKVPWEK